MRTNTLARRLTIPTKAEILKRQKRRLKKLSRKRIKNAKRNRNKKKALPKAAPVVAPVLDEAPVKKRFRGKPANGGTSWVITPSKAIGYTIDELADSRSMAELRDIGKQYDVKGSSKVELAHDIIEAANLLLA